MKSPLACAGILIRRPAAEVFRAFADPAVTTRFWFTKATGPLALDERVRWSWEMYGASTEVLVRELVPDSRIVIQWNLDLDPTEVRWTFTPRPEGTFVEVENRGFAPDEDGVAKAMVATNGFTLVLAAAKIWLEHGIDPRFVIDRHPDAVVEGWREPA